MTIATSFQSNSFVDKKKNQAHKPTAHPVGEVSHFLVLSVNYFIESCHH
jgi:hypothetical protein